MTAPSDIRCALPSSLTPDLALDRLASLPGRVLLETRGTGGRTLLSAEPQVELRWDGAASWIRLGGKWRKMPEGTDPLDILGGSLSRWEEGVGAGIRGPEFQGGWIGYLGYETAALTERLPQPPDRDHWDLLPLWFGAYDWAVVWENGATPALRGRPLPVLGPWMEEGVGQGLGRRLEKVRRLLEGRGSDQEGEGPDREGGRRGESVLDPPEVESSLGRSGYVEGVGRIREYIRAGDIFQANLTHRLQAPWAWGGVSLYRRLREASPAPYGAYLETGRGQVASVSPEGFLEVKGRKVTTRPIKGTAPRGRTRAEDMRLAQGLQESEKDRAENVMIVDLLRNDLSRVCEPGSVQVPGLCVLEEHPTVHHLVSTVEGVLAEGAGPGELLRATLPGGSITGAPKIRAMEIINELEPVPRGVYTGALGILEPGGRMNLSIAIRTATLRNGVARFGVGGGITLRSDPVAEWAESMDKARPFLRAVGAAGTGVGEGRERREDSEALNGGAA